MWFRESQAHLALCFGWFLSCLAYSLNLKVEMICSSEYWAVSELQDHTFLSHCHENLNSRIIRSLLVHLYIENVISSQCYVFILELRGLCPVPCCNSGLIWDNECLKGYDRIPCIGDLQDANGFLEIITCSRISVRGRWGDQKFTKNLRNFRLMTNVTLYRSAPP
jgi:hypothetical protein